MMTFFNGCSINDEDYLRECVVTPNAPKFKLLMEIGRGLVKKC